MCKTLSFLFPWKTCIAHSCASISAGCSDAPKLVGFGWRRKRWAASRAALLRVLSFRVSDPLYCEFHNYRSSNFAPLVPFIDPTPDALYRRFVRAMEAGGMIDLCRRNPALARSWQLSPT